jgi:hypothetical protein
MRLLNQTLKTDVYTGLMERRPRGEGDQSAPRKTNSIWIALGLNPGLHGEKLATNHISYNMACVCV